MKVLAFYTAPLFIIFLLPICNAQRINPGAYQEYGKQNTILREKEEIILYPDRNQTFEYRRYSDKMEEEKYGSGVYRQTSKKLILRFNKTHPPRSFVEVLNKKPSSGEITYQFDIAESQTGEPVTGARVYIHDHMKKTIAESTSDSNGHVSITVSNAAYPAFFQIESPVHVPVRDDLEELNTNYLAYMATKYGKIIKEGTVMKFEILNVDQERIRLKRDDKEKYFALKKTE